MIFKKLQLTIRGASHAAKMEFSLSGFPRGMRVDFAALAKLMARRSPGHDLLSSARQEPDRVEFIRGIEDGVTSGGTIVGHIANVDCRPEDYRETRTIPRPGHADFGQWIEYGMIPTGGGANSGRLTAALCGAGALCRQWLQARGISVTAKLASVGTVDATARPRQVELENAILSARQAGDSVGGTVTCEITGVHAGIGGALFAGLETEFAAALFAIPGVKGLEFGNGFAAATLRGSENNDEFLVDATGVRTKTNRHGGILGGRTTGLPIDFRVAFKPTPTIFKSQASVELTTMRPAICVSRGRHDPCIARRAVPVVEAVASLVIADVILADEAAHPRVCLTLTGRTLKENLAQYRSQRYFTDMVELRLDLLSQVERKRAYAFPKLLATANHHAFHVPVILTCRRQCDGGEFKGSECVRTACLEAAMAKGVFDYVDFEADFRVAKLERIARESGTRIIRSLHSFDGPIRKVADRCRELVGASDEIAKIAFMPKSLADVSRLFHETAKFTEVPHVVCAMGPLGFATRALAVRTHSLWVYASVAGDGGLGSLGQVSPQELVRTYRFRSVTREAELFGVTGFPLAATESPAINNAAWLAEDRDAVMVPFPAASAREALAFMKAMRMRGLAVTIPHKQAICPLLDRLSPLVRRIGAVNTVALENGKYVGYNTDVAGFSQALAALVRTVEADTCSSRRLRAALLGDGGAAQAVKAALKALKIPFAVFHRRPLAAGFGLIVNATPVDPIPDYEFTGRELVFDLNYTPSLTPLLQRAQAAGCRVANGLPMLAAQAYEQRKIWQR